MQQLLLWCKPLQLSSRWVNLRSFGFRLFSLTSSAIDHSAIVHPNGHGSLLGIPLYCVKLIQLFPWQMGNTCLHYAVVAKDKDRVKLLLSPKYNSGEAVEKESDQLWE